jgi:2'-5' RNA ligase
MIRLARCAPLLLAAALLAACAGDPVPVERFYRPPLEAPAARAPLPLRVVIESFDAEGLYADRALVFRNADGVYEQFHYHSWIEAPGMLLRDALADYLRAAFGAEHVFTPEARVEGDVRVRARLRRLEELHDAAAPRAAFGLEAVVSDRDDQFLGLVKFDDSQACAGAAPGACQAAFAELIERSFAQLADLLDAKARPLPMRARRHRRGGAGRRAVRACSSRCGAQLAAAAALIPPGAGARISRVKPQRYHLTLAFQGSLDPLQLAAAQQAADCVRAPPFRLVLDHVGFFDGPRAVWIGPRTLPPALAQLKAELDRELLRFGLPVERGRFTPHLTCLRGMRAPPEAPPVCVDWWVRDFVLVKTVQRAGGASNYRVLGRWQLAPAPAPACSVPP